jgi:hypothetical protein
MNAGSPHLDLGQLLADVDYASPDDPASAHLAACPACRTEKDRWAAVAAGVRQLAAATPPAPGLLALPALTRKPSALRQSRVTRPPRRRRAAAVAVAAAAALVAGGTAYGLTAAQHASSARPGTTAGLTAVQGCPGTYLAAGTLAKVSGTQAIIQPRITVATSASTVITRPVSGTVSDITDGSHVVVLGTWSRRRLAATEVGIEVGLPRVQRLGIVAVAPQSPFARQAPHLRKSTPIKVLLLPFAAGTVADAHRGSFTLVLRNPVMGVRRIQVLTSNSTKVLARASASLSQLGIGGNVVAVGKIGSRGVLRASTMAETSVTGIITGGSLLKVRPSGCSAAAIETAAVLAGS